MSCGVLLIIVLRHLVMIKRRHVYCTSPHLMQLHSQVIKMCKNTKILLNIYTVLLSFILVKSFLSDEQNSLNNSDFNV